MTAPAAGRPACPHCGAEQAARQKFCWLCHYPITPGTAASPAPALPATPALVPRAPAADKKEFSQTSWIVMVAQFAAVVGAFSVSRDVGLIAAIILCIPIGFTLKDLYGGPAAAPEDPYGGEAEKREESPGMHPLLFALKALGMTAAVIVLVPVAVAVALCVACFGMTAFN